MLPAAPAVRRAPSRSRRLDPISLAALRSFVSVVEAGSFSAAARLLGNAVSTVSKHVDFLEDRLQTTLLTRSTRRMNLSEAGSRFYHSCRATLDNLEATLDRDAPSGEIAGRLRVVSPPAFALHVLAPALPAFLARHPLLDIELKVTTASFDLLRDQVDVAIRTTISHGSEGHLERIGRVPSRLCAAPAYVAAEGLPRQPDDLRQHRCLAGINSPFSDIWRFRQRGRIREIKIDSSFASDNGDLLRSLCLAGLGICGFYNFHVRGDLDAGRLLPILDRFACDEGHLYAATPSQRFMPRSTEAFLDFTRSLCAALPEA